DANGDPSRPSDRDRARRRLGRVRVSRWRDSRRHRLHGGRKRTGATDARGSCRRQRRRHPAGGVGMNTVSLIGRLGGDPQLRHTPNGTAVANASIAVPRRGNREETDWFDLTFWGKTAELAANHLTKGRQVGVTGRLQQERWEKD